MGGYTAGEHFVLSALWYACLWSFAEPSCVVLGVGHELLPAQCALQAAAAALPELAMAHAAEEPEEELLVSVPSCLGCALLACGRLRNPAVCSHWRGASAHVLRCMP